VLPDATSKRSTTGALTCTLGLLGWPRVPQFDARDCLLAKAESCCDFFLHFARRNGFPDEMVSLFIGRDDIPPFLALGQDGKCRPPLDDQVWQCEAGKALTVGGARNYEVEALAPMWLLLLGPDYAVAKPPPDGLQHVAFTVGQDDAQPPVRRCVHVALSIGKTGEVSGKGSIAPCLHCSSLPVACAVAVPVVEWITGRIAAVEARAADMTTRGAA